MRFVVTCGGTGGHVFPGVSTANELVRQGHEVALMLSGRAVETPTANGWSGTVLAVSCPQPRWRTPWSAVQSVAGLLGAVRKARRHLRAFRPDALLAMGSYTSFGPVIAARGLRVPILLHDANVVPGAAVSRLARFAACVAVSFDETPRYLPKGVRTVNTGLPVRTELAGRPPLPDLGPGAFTVLVMGGSQGARAVNTLAVGAFRELANRGQRDWRILHLAGRNEADAVRAAYADAGLAASVHGFLADMGGAYAASDLCVSRSGAAACFELCLCGGPPPLLIPLPTAARDHQTANARSLADAGAAELLPQAALTPAALADRLATLRADGARRDAMRVALRRMARPDAAQRLACLVVETARTTR